MSNEIAITIVGNLTDNPELRFTPSGDAVCKFRIAHTPRFLNRQTQQWTDGEPTFLSCTVWRQQAENVAESAARGTRVIIEGRLRTRTYETREGEKRTVQEIEADEVGVALRYATAKVTKTARSDGGDDWGGASKSRPAGNDKTPPANADQQRAAQQAAPANADASPW